MGGFVDAVDHAKPALQNRSSGGNAADERLRRVGAMGSAAYLRFPSVQGDAVAFVAEDDIWLGSTDGGRAWRLTADRAPVAHTRLSPAGDMVAYTSRRDGAPEVHVVATDGGPPRRLTHWGSDFTRVLGWTDHGRVLAASAAGEPFRSRTWAYAVPLDAGPPEQLPYGPVNAIAAGPAGASAAGPAGPIVLGVHGNRRGAAAWKRYRGGTAGQLWIDATGTGEFSRLGADLNGQLEDPAWIDERLTFLSDHEGYGNVYSFLSDGSDLRRHTDHDDFYARAAHSDGRRLVYQCAGELWLLDELSAGSQPQRLAIQLAGSGTALSRHAITAADHVGSIALDRTGRASAIEVRGSVHWVAHRDGPAPQLAGTPGVRHRLPRVLGSPPPTDEPADEKAAEADAGSAPSAADGARDGARDVAPQDGAPRDGARHGVGGSAVRVVVVTDADGDDALEILTIGGQHASRRIAGGELGRVLNLAASPDGRWVATASHNGRVLLIEVASGAVRQLDASSDGDASGLAFSPDSRWLAWSHPGPEPLRQIRLAEVGGGGAVIEATPLRFTDTEPVFTMDGKHLAFLSVRTLSLIHI